MDGDKRDRSGWNFLANFERGRAITASRFAAERRVVNDPPVASDKYLDVGTFFIFEAWWAQLTFRHNFNLQSGFDGRVLEISSFYS